MRPALILILCPVCLIGSCLFATLLSAQQRQTFEPAYQVYRFDAGNVVASPETIQLDLAHNYSPARGFGWSLAPVADFSRQSLAKFRALPLQDGVSGKAIGFRADVPEGRWWITLWMEAGLEETNTAQLSINGKPTPLKWNPFDAPAEPRTSIQKPYRLFHKRVQVTNQGLQFQLEGRADSVRVLAFTLYPDPDSALVGKEFISNLQKMGQYSSMIYEPMSNLNVFDYFTSATDLLESWARMLEAGSENELFTAYWKDQLDRQIRAERLFAMRGWEWANKETGLSLFERIHQAIMILDGILDQPPEGYPLYERAQITRGRLLHWLKIEGSNASEIPGVRTPDMVRLYAEYPQDTLLSMYNGKMIDLPDACDDLSYSPQAPAWAVAQHETLCRLRSISHWWIDRQQAENGELGGKLGDDVEILRWWPALIMSGDSVTYKGWKRLADGVWNSGKLKDGYAKNVSDVEHASEFVSDTAPVMAMFSDDPLYTDRLKPSAHHFEKLWTGVSQQGRRFFKSAWFSAHEIEEVAPKNRDVEYNTRATKALRYLAWKTGDPAVVDLLSQWSNSWATVAMQTAKGKPPGIVPASVRYPDEVINGDEENWYDANMYWPYYNWNRHAGSMMLDQLFFTYTLTKDEHLLAPLLASLALIQQQLPLLAHNEQPVIGSPAWAAQTLMRNTKFWGVVSQWRLYTDIDRFDDLIGVYGPPYMRYRLTKEERFLVEGLQEILDKVRYNTPMLTYEGIHTDRIYVTDSGAGSSHLKAMLTGDGIIEDMSPYPVVTWANTDHTFTGLVTDASTSHLALSLYLFTNENKRVNARLWQLLPGGYQLTIKTGRQEIEKIAFEITTTGQEISMDVPGNKDISVLIDKVSR